MVNAGNTYWLSEADDESMQDEHRFIWDAMLETIDTDLQDKHVLDAGCNQGGFLRLLCDRHGIATGHGYDPAAAAIADAKRLAGDRPLSFEAADIVPSGWDDFDVAFSHEVLYLLHDLHAHASGVARALAPGGVYYAVIGIHADSPVMAGWHRENAERLDLPPLHALDDIIAVFTDLGLRAAVARLNIRFVPVSGHATSFPASLDYFYEHKVMLRFAKPAA